MFSLNVFAISLPCVLLCQLNSAAWVSLRPGFGLSGDGLVKTRNEIILTTVTTAPISILDTQ